LLTVFISGVLEKNTYFENIVKEVNEMGYNITQEFEECNVIVMLPFWNDYKDANTEWKEAKKQNIPIFYWPFDKDKMRWFWNTHK
jgi:hypothetical protein